MLHTDIYAIVCSVRFPCCGKLYPCDKCHDEKETDHEMEMANRMVCGYCSKEQVIYGIRVYTMLEARVFMIIYTTVHTCMYIQVTYGVVFFSFIHLIYDTRYMHVMYR